MRFGKREQIVVLGLAVLGTIGLLHLLFFSGRASELATSFKKVQELEGQVRDLKRIADMGRFNKFKEMTKALGTTYTDVITSLSLTHPPEFNALRLDDVVITPPKGAAKEQIQKMKEAKLNEMRKEQSGKQLDLIYAQLEKLQEFAADAERNDETKTKAYFLGNFSGKGGGWNLPIALPKDLYSPNNKSDIGKLVDKLRELSQNKGMLDVINKEQTELQKKQRDIYERILSDHGIVPDDYRQVGKGSLAWMGEYVPLAHKLTHAMILEKALAVDPDRDIGGKKATRNQILEWYEISPPSNPLGTFKVSELYFVYEELRTLNGLLEMMNQKDQNKPVISQLFGVRFDNLAYINQMGVMKPADPSAKAERTSQEINPCPYVLPPDEVSTKMSVTPPDSDDLALGFIITLQFRATNRNAWNFIYTVLGKYPLAELDEAKILATPEGGDVNCEVKFLFIPYLFAIEGEKAAPAKKGAPPPKPAVPPPAAPSGDSAKKALTGLE